MQKIEERFFTLSFFLLLAIDMWKFEHLMLKKHDIYEKELI